MSIELSGQQPSQWHEAVTPPHMRRAVASAPWRLLPAWLVLFAVPAYQLMAAASWGAFMSAAALIGVWFAAEIGTGLPRAAGVPTWTRWLCLAAFAAFVVARVIRGNLSSTVSATQLITPALLVAALAVIIWDMRAGVRRSTPLLRWPLPAGRWLICEGTNRWLNHHWPAPRQRAALDLVGLTPAGRSFRGWQPRTINSFVSTGATVTSPVDGTVIVARDDCPLWPAAGVPATGNHVIVDGGHCRVLLAHFLPGSITVQEGDVVTAGEPLGQVGTSGNSTQPHLHIHAIDDDGPLVLRFPSVRHTRRGCVIRTR